MARKAKQIEEVDSGEFMFDFDLSGVDDDVVLELEDDGEVAFLTLDAEDEE